MLIFEWTHLEKSHTIARDATKCYVTETSQKWRFLGILNEKNCSWQNIFTGPILEISHTIARDATKTYITETSQKWRFLGVLNEKNHLWQIFSQDP